MEYEKYVEIRKKAIKSQMTNDDLYFLIREYCTDYGHSDQEYQILITALPSIGISVQTMLNNIFEYYDKKLSIVKLINNQGVIIDIL